jgi:hypothetical protein
VRIRSDANEKSVLAYVQVGLPASCVVCVHGVYGCAESIEPHRRRTHGAISFKF